MVVNGLAPIVAPVLGGALLSFMNWKGLFLALSVVSAVLLLVSFYGLEETWSKKTTAPGEISGVIKSFVLIGSDWKFIGLCLTQGFMMAGMFAYIGASSYVLQKIYALTPQAFSLCFAINGLGLILFSLVGAELSGHYGEDRILRSALIFAIVAAVALFICGYLSFSLPFILVALFFAISINSIICTIISSLAMQRQGDNAGSASACLGSAMFILGGISVPLTGLGGISINTMTIIILVCYIIAALLYKSLVLDL
jgi:DHA1 family bicyclomycin/chloramphenicol resistance-like MFS transporter